MRSLTFRLSAAFALIILLGAGITYLVSADTASSQFGLYVSRRAQLQAAAWAPLLADFYARTGTWVGIETVMAQLPALEVTHGGRGQGRDGGQGQGRGPLGGMMGAMDGDSVVLANADGAVVYDSAGQPVGRMLTDAELAEGTPIAVQGRMVGTLVVFTQAAAVGTPGADFLGALNRGILLAAVAAGVIALVLGTVLVRQITSPLRRLELAARAIAAGDLAQRVPVTTHDELGNVAQAFNQMAAGLEQNETARRHMMADVAHELRTPLTVLQGQVEALLDGVFAPTPEHLGPLHDQTILLSRLVNDLRDVALAEAGKLRLEVRPIDLGALTLRVVTAVEPAAREKGIQLVTQAPPGLPAVEADGDRLRQVLHNLLSNALRHTPAGGEIHVVVEETTPRNGFADQEAHGTGVTTGGPQAGRWLQVSVSDTGSGIAPEDLPYVFDRFYRSRQAQAPRQGPARMTGLPPAGNASPAPFVRDSGSGLGLTIARTLVEAHGGRIWVASEIGHGTQIAFCLPTVVPPAPSKDAVKSRPDGTGTSGQTSPHTSGGMASQNADRAV